MTSGGLPSGIGQAGLRDQLASPRLQLQVLLVLAVALGGGGVAYGLHNLIIQLTAVAILAANADRVALFFRQQSPGLIALVVATLALPVLQLIPLPAQFWQALPGRDLVQQSFALALVDPRAWSPASLDPARTLVALCGTLAPAAIIVIGSSCSREDRLLLVATVAAAAVAAFVFGAIQLSSANSWGMIYPIRPAADVLYATFANRNSAGLMFVLATALLAAMPNPAAIGWRWARLAAGALLATGVVLTQSRSSMVLLAVVAAFLLLRLACNLWRSRPTGRSASPIAIAGLSVIGVVIAAVLGVSTMTDGGRVATSLQRFQTLETDRLEMWDDGFYAAEHYWPAGSGMGTFDEVFQVHESLEYVSPRTAGRAHNDFIEIAIEGGIAALALAAMWLAWSLAVAVRESVKRSAWLPLGAGLGISCIALQSMLDYPLRNQTLLCVAAVMIVLLARQQRPTQ